MSTFIVHNLLRKNEQKAIEVTSCRMLSCSLSVSPRFSFVLHIFLVLRPCFSVRVPAGEAPQCHSGLQGRQRAERSAAAFSAAAAGHVDGEYRSRLGAGGDSD